MSGYCASDIKTALWEKAKEGEETAEIYRREARAAYEKDAEAAAAFLLDAAYANEHDGASPRSVARDLALAAQISPDSLWVCENAFRMQLKLGNLQDAANMLMRAYDLASGSDRQSVALALGDLFWIAVQDPAQALKWVETALSADETNVAARYMALWINTTPGDHADLQKAEQNAEKLARILGTPDERAILYDFAGAIQSAMGNYPKSYETYRLAFQSDKQNPYILLRYATLSEKYSKFSDAAAAYAQLAQIFEDAELRAAFCRRAATICGFLGQCEQQSHLCAEAYKLGSGKCAAALRAADAYMLAGNAARAAEFEKILIDLAPDPAMRSAHWLALADLNESADRGDAQICQALEAACQNAQTPLTLARLAAICEKLGDPEQQARRFGQLARSQSQAGAAYARMQGIAALKAGNAGEAIGLLSPKTSDLGYIRCLFYYEQSKNHEANARLLEAWIRKTNDPATKSALLEHLVTILSERLGHDEIAAQYLARCPQTGSSRGLALKRMLIFARLGRWDEVVAGLDSIAQETSDPDEARLFALEAAAYADEALHDPDAAIEKLRKLRQNAPTFVPAVVALRHLALREKKYDLLIESNECRAQFQMAQKDRAEIAAENAWAALRMNDADAALKWFQTASAGAPLSAYAFRCMLLCLRKKNDWDEIARRIDRLGACPNADDSKPAETSPDSSAFDGGGKSNAAPQASSDQIPGAAAPDQASSADQIAVPNDSESDESSNIIPPQELAVWRAFRHDIEMYCADSADKQNNLGSDDDIVDIYSLASKLIGAYRRDPDRRAIPDLTRCKQKIPELSEEVSALLDWTEAERLRAHAADPKEKRQIPLLLKRSLSLPFGKSLRASYLRALREIDGEDLADWLESCANVSQDRWIQDALRREAALRLICAGNANDGRARKLLSGQSLRDAGDKRALWMLECFSAVTEDWQALGYFREKLANADISGRMRVQTLKTALAPYIDDDQNAHAVRVAQECLKLDANAICALIALACIAEDEDSPQSLACIADRLAQASNDPENRLSYGMWAANIWTKVLKNPEQAVKSLAHILAFRPDCDQAVEMIENLLIPMQRFEQLSAIYNRAVGATSDDRRQIEWLRKNARLRAQKIRDIPGATLALARIIEKVPDDADALRLQADLLIAQARWTEAADALEHLSKLGLEPKQRRELNLQYADILVRRMDQSDKARVLLRKHLAAFPGDMAALALLCDIARAERRWNDAKRVLEEICQASGEGEFCPTPKDIRRARREFTQIAREAGWGQDMRALCEREAIQAVIDDRTEFDELVQDYKNHNEIPRLIDVARRLLRQQGSPEAVAQFRGCVAALYVADRQYREALAFLSEIIHDGQNTDWAYLARAQALASAGQIDSAVGEFRRALKQNIDLDDAYAPFIDILKQTGDAVSLAAVEALRRAHATPQETIAPARCIQGAPRGFFDFELIPVSRAFADARRYLRMMIPCAYDLFGDAVSSQPLTPVPWAQARCQTLFGQNFDVRQVYAVHGLKGAKCRIKFDQPDAFVADDSILNESDTIQFDFWSAYAMHQTVTGAALLDALSDDTVAALFAALCQPKPDSEAAQTIKKRLFKILPRQSRKLFKDGVPFLMVSWQDFRRAMQTRAASLGAVVCASPECALCEIPGNQAFETFLLSENYARFVKLFRTAPDNA